MRGQIGFHSLPKLVIEVVVAVAVLYVLLSILGLVKPPS